MVQPRGALRLPPRPAGKADGLQLGQPEEDPLPQKGEEAPIPEM